MDNIIKKKRKVRTKRNYFTQETEDAIIAYNHTKSQKEKNKIYEEKIHYPFFKLTQNIIHTFKFYQTEVENLEHLQHEIEIFLLSKLYLFDPIKSANDRISKTITKNFGEVYKGDFTKYMPKNAQKCTALDIQKFVTRLDVSDECMVKLLHLKPAKAFSYFGTIVKRWLINYTTENYKKKLKTTSITELSNFSENSSFNLNFINNSQTLKDIDFISEENEISMDGSKCKPKDKLSSFIDSYVEFCTDNIYTFFPKKYDAQIADSILELFRKRDIIDVFNKKALYIYIREQIPQVKTPKITKISKKLKTVFEDKYKFFLEHDYFIDSNPTKKL